MEVMNARVNLGLQEGTVKQVTLKLKFFWKGLNFLKTDGTVTAVNNM